MQTCMGYSISGYQLEPTSLNLTFSHLDLITNSSFCLLYNSYDISLENKALDQLIIPLQILFYILITFLLDIVLVL